MEFFIFVRIVKEVFMKYLIIFIFSFMEFMKYFQVKLVIVIMIFIDFMQFIVLLFFTLIINQLKINNHYFHL
jgi:hypothetical protein